MQFKEKKDNVINFMRWSNLQSVYRKSNPQSVHSNISVYIFSFWILPNANIVYIYKQNTARACIDIAECINQLDKKNVTFSFCDSNRFRIFLHEIFYINYYFLLVIPKLFTWTTIYWKFILCLFFFKLFRKKLFLCILEIVCVCVCICVQILDPKFWYCITEMQWFRTTVSKMCVNYQIYKFHWIQKPTQPMLRSILIGYISIHPFYIQICMTCAKSHGLRLKHVISVMFRRCILNKRQIRQIHAYLSPIRKLVFIMLKKVSYFHHALYFGEIIFKF